MKIGDIVTFIDTYETRYVFENMGYNYIGKKIKIIDVSNEKFQLEDLYWYRKEWLVLYNEYLKKPIEEAINLLELNGYQIKRNLKMLN